MCYRDLKKPTVSAMLNRYKISLMVVYILALRLSNLGAVTSDKSSSRITNHFMGNWNAGKNRSPITIANTLAGLKDAGSIQIDRLGLQFSKIHVHFKDLKDRTLMVISEPVGGNHTDVKHNLLITWQLMYNDVTSANCNEGNVRQILPVHDNKTVEALCKADLHTGRLEDQKWQALCQLNAVELPMENKVEELEMELFPYHHYQINVTEYKTNTTHIFKLKTYHYEHCSQSTKPLMPPFADQTSFRYQDEIDLEGHHIVTLYWRKLPEVLKGAPNISYTIDCGPHAIGGSKLEVSELIGKVNIRKNADSDLSCNISSKNALGISENSSQIYVPPRGNLTLPSHLFRLAAYKTDHTTYRLEWNTINANVSLNQGDYVVYWCSSGSLNGDCTELDGLAPLLNVSTSFTINFPPMRYPGHLEPKFGLAYRHGPRYSTGILWNRCGLIGNDQRRVSPGMTLQPNVSTDTLNQDRLTVYWSFSECDSSVINIKEYEFECCEIPKSQVCSLLWGQSVSIDPRKFSFKGASDNCRFFKAANHFNVHAQLINLRPETIYFVRGRFRFHNETSDEWGPTGTMQNFEECETSPWLFVLVLVFILIGALLYRYCRARYEYFKDMKRRLKHTRENIIKNVDMTGKLEAEELARKYYIDREIYISMEDIPTNASQHDIDSKERCRIDRNNEIGKNFDYVPRNLLEPNSGRTTPENPSDSTRDLTRIGDTSDLDDVSISSQSSFLNNIFSQEPAQQLLPQPPSRQVPPMPKARNNHEFIEDKERLGND